ncbi:hypothetical protein LEMLEM_LOCUS12489 [Lemmus lemmus]
MCFVKKHSTKGLKKIQANNMKAMSTHVEAIKVIVKPKVVKFKISKGPRYRLSFSAFITQTKFGKQINNHMANGHRLLQTNPKVLTKAEASDQTQAQASAPAQALKSVLAPMNAHGEGFCLPI